MGQRDRQDRRAPGRPGDAGPDKSAGTAPASTGAASAPAAKTTTVVQKQSSNKGLSIAALVLALIAVVVGVVAVTRGRSRVAA